MQHIKINEKEHDLRYNSSKLIPRLTNIKWGFCMEIRNALQYVYRVINIGLDDAHK